MPTSCLKLHGEKLSWKQNSVFYFFSLGTAFYRNKDIWYMLYAYFFKENLMQLFLSWFGVTRMAKNAEKDILVEYSKSNLCFHYGRVIHVINLFFYGEHDGNIFVLIWRHQDGLERREGHPGGVQQEKLRFPLWTCDTCYNPIFLRRIRWKIFIMI